MFDVGFWELTIIGVVALIIVGPERLPGLARTAGLWIGKGRRMIADVKRDIDREIKASEMSDLKDGLDSARKEVEKAADNIKQASGADEIQSSIRETVDESRSGLDEIDRAAKDMENEIAGNETTVADSSAGDDTGVRPDGQDDPVKDAAPETGNTGKSAAG